MGRRLQALGDSTAPGLNQRASLSVAGVSIQEFLRGLAETHSLNVSIDPALQVKVSNNFTDVKVVDLLLFLAREYDLDVRVTGNIIAFYKYVPAPEAKPVLLAKKLRLSYDSPQDRFTADLAGDSLSSFVKQATQLTKRNIVLAPGLGGRTITGYVEAMPLAQALDRLAYANALRLVRVDDQSYVLQSTEPVTTTATTARPARTGRGTAGNGVGLSNPGRSSLSGADVVVAAGADGQSRVSIDADNVSIGQLLTDVSLDMGVNYVLFSELTGNTTMHIRQLAYADFLALLLQGTTHTFEFTAGRYAIGGRALEGFRRSRVVKLQFRPADKLDEVIPTELKKGVEIKVFKELNSVILSGSPPQIDEIAEFLKSIDKPVVNVLIEVIVAELRRGHTVSTGISAALGDSTVKTGGTVFPGLDMTLNSKSINSVLSKLSSRGLVDLGRVTPNFYVTLQALEQNSYLNIRSTPKLATLNGHEASLKIGQSVYYVETVQNVSGGVTPIITRSQVFKQVSADLSIKINPMVSGDDNITLTVDAQFSDFIDPVIVGAPPGNATRQFTSMIRVKNEDMIVLGGLEEVRKTRSGSGVPILSRIPILKWLFSSRRDAKQTNKLVVFIKPTIMY
ncbi:MAG: ral secretion pathway protein GspD [Hymenobacter sp.]|nr:ral secretion pathway protein GspD [Hymenobacter sp.]